jgi:lipopolysaccharide export system permease protein
VWRTGVPLSALALSMLAIPLSFVNPRVGRSINLIIAALVYLIYNNSISVFQSWVEQGKISFMTGLLVPHLVVFAIVALMFYRRVSVSSLWRKFRRRA